MTKLLVFIILNSFFSLHVISRQLEDIKSIRNKYNKQLYYNQYYKLKNDSITSQMVNNLEVLCKVWGFLKYYHPNISDGKYNWDFELLNIIQDIKTAKNDSIRNLIISKWILRFGEIKRNNNTEKVNLLNIKTLPDLKWSEDSLELGTFLVKQIKDIRINENRSKGFYFKTEQGKNLINELKYDSTVCYYENYRLLSLFRYWNLVQYYFPYKYLMEENWNNVLIEFIPKFIKINNITEYYNLLLNLATRLHDSHAIIFYNKQKNKYFLPYDISFVENKAVIIDVNKVLIDSLNSLKIGDVITSINNESVEKIIKRKLPYVSGSNFATILRNISNYLRSSEESILYVEYERKGLYYKTKIKCYNYNILQATYILKPCIEIIDNKIAYLRIESIKEDSIKKIKKIIKNTDGVIIDMRNVYNEDFADGYFWKKLIKLNLLCRNYPFAVFSEPDKKNPGQYNIGIPTKIGVNKRKLYKGKIIVLVNDKSQSAGEYRIMALQSSPKTITIGTTTAGADGNVKEFFLLGEISTWITTIGVYYPNGTETQRVGVRIDIKVNPTIEGIRKGRDEMTEKAIEIIKK